MKKPNLNITPVNLPKISTLDLLKIYSEKVRCENSEHKTSQVGIELKTRLTREEYVNLLSATGHLQMNHGNAEFDDLIKELINLQN